MKQVDKPVQFALVPFSASVNVAPVQRRQDLDGHDGYLAHPPREFRLVEDDPTTNRNQLGDRFAEKVGDVWYKRGAGWGDSENQPLTRFSLYSDMIAKSGREEIPGIDEYICVRMAEQRHVQRRMAIRTTPTPPASLPPGRAASRRAPSPTTTTTRRRRAAIRRRCSCRCSPRTRPKHLWRDLDRDGDTTT